MYPWLKARYQTRRREGEFRRRAVSGESPSFLFCNNIWNKRKEVEPAGGSEGQDKGRGETRLPAIQQKGKKKGQTEERDNSLGQSSNVAAKEQKKKKVHPKETHNKKLTGHTIEKERRIEDWIRRSHAQCMDAGKYLLQSPVLGLHQSNKRWLGPWYLMDWCIVAVVAGSLWGL